MYYRRRIYFSLGLLLALAFIFGWILFYATNQKNTEIIFFDVGQGDAILIQQGSYQVLIDGGRDGKTLLEKLGTHVSFWDRTIDVVMVTHPDQDHIGGLIDLLKNYSVKTVIETKAENDSQTFKVLEEEIAQEMAEKIEAKKDVTLKFPRGGELTVLYPSESVSSGGETNEKSVVAKFTFGESSFLFTGDLPTTKEEELISGNLNNLDVDVLKVSHHGSKYSTGEEFLKAVTPKEAIISVGKNNMYGHPNPETLERLLKIGTKIFRTDESGDVRYNCVDQNLGCLISF